MTKHRSFKLDKFLKAVDPQLRNQFFAKFRIAFPRDVNFDDNSLDEFWGTIPEAERVETEERLHCINDTADHARDCLERACVEVQRQ